MQSKFEYISINSEEDSVTAKLTVTHTINNPAPNLFQPAVRSSCLQFKFTKSEKDWYLNMKCEEYTDLFCFKIQRTIDAIVSESPLVRLVKKTHTELMGEGMEITKRDFSIQGIKLNSALMTTLMADLQRHESKSTIESICLPQGCILQLKQALGLVEPIHELHGFANGI